MTRDGPLQPIVDVATDQIAGFEALARLTRSDGVVLQPSSFIDVAEAGGLIMPLGSQVLEVACGGGSRLHLELTETAIIDLLPTTLTQLGRITDLGIEIGLDDFGTGYASLTHLRRLPVRFVKIDQSFVQGLETDREDERIVAAAIDLAANLGLRLIAEGVETPFQMARLRELPAQLRSRGTPQVLPVAKTG